MESKRKVLSLLLSPLQINDLENMFGALEGCAGVYFHRGYRGNWNGPVGMGLLGFCTQGGPIPTCRL